MATLYRNFEKLCIQTELEVDTYIHYISHINMFTNAVLQLYVLIYVASLPTLKEKSGFVFQILWLTSLKIGTNSH